MSSTVIPRRSSKRCRDEVSRCFTCCKILIDPYISTCGHSICYFCYQKWLKDEGYPYADNDETKIKGKCQECGKVEVKFSPNTMLNTRLESTFGFHPEYKRCKRLRFESFLKSNRVEVDELLSTCDENILVDFVEKLFEKCYPQLPTTSNIVSFFKQREQVILLTSIDVYDRRKFLDGIHVPDFYRNRLVFTTSDFTYYIFTKTNNPFPKNMFK